VDAVSSSDKVQAFLPLLLKKHGVVATEMFLVILSHEPLLDSRLAVHLVFIPYCGNLAAVLMTI
jgi:hypothetical protein